MSIDLNLATHYVFEVNASAETTFLLLSDISKASSLHPTLHSIKDMGKGIYRWEMKKYGAGKFHVQTVYTCQYYSDAVAGTVVWTPVEGEGNAQVSGSFIVKAQGKNAIVEANIEMNGALPLPAIMKKMALQMIASENRKLTEKYIANLMNELDGGRIIRL